MKDVLNKTFIHHACALLVVWKSCESTHDDNLEKIMSKGTNKLLPPFIILFKIPKTRGMGNLWGTCERRV